MLNLLQGKKKICVVGGDRCCEDYIKILYKSGCLRGIVEPDLTRLSELLDKYPLAPGYSVVERALKDYFDGYVVTTPAETHFSIGSMLLKEKQNVLIKSPVSLSSMDSMNLVRLVEIEGSKLMVGNNLIFHPAILRMKEMIDSGVIGSLFYVYSNHLDKGAVQDTEDVIWYLAAHDVSMLNYLIGDLPSRIFASGECYLQKAVHDIVTIYFDYPGSVKAQFLVSGLYPFNEYRLVAVGSKGMVSFERTSKAEQLLFYDIEIGAADSKPLKNNGQIEVMRYDKVTPLENELKYFISHLDGSLPVSNGQSGHETIKILEEVERVARTWASSEVRKIYAGV